MIKAPYCNCGSLAQKPMKDWSNEKSIIWLCKHGHTTKIVYASLDDIKFIPQLLGIENSIQ